MATATVEGYPVKSAVVTIPATGVWSYKAELAGSVSLAIGASVEMRLLDMTLRGTVTRGGPGLGSSFYRVLGGGAGWRLSSLARPFWRSSGVLLSAVLSDAAKSVGEVIELAAGEERTLGEAEVTEGGVASRVPASLCPGRWYMRLDGVTQIGARSTGNVAAGYQVIGEPDPSALRGVVASEAPGTITPGLSIDLGFDAPMQIGLVIHKLDDEKLRSHVYGRAIDATVRSIVRESTPDDTYKLLHPYEVFARSRDRFDLRSTNKSMPDLRNVEARAGAAGSSAALTVGCAVLVAFERADRTKPFIAFYTPIGKSGFRPLNASLDADSLVHLGEHASTVLCGPSPGYALVKYAELNTWAGLVNTALSGLGAPIAPLGSAATTVLKGS